MVMSNTQGQNDKEAEGRSSKIRTALFWVGVVALAVFPFPWWP
jgi:hypothetical protein